MGFLGRVIKEKSGHCRTGGLSLAIVMMVALLGVMPSAFAGGGPPECDDCTDVELQIAILVDVGTDDDPADFTTRLEAIAGAIEAIVPDGKTEVTIVEHSTSDTFVEVEPTVISDIVVRAAVANAVHNLDQESDSTQLEDAVDLAYDVIENSPRFYCADQQVIIGIVDGPTGDPGDLGGIVNDALLAGVDEFNIISIGTLDPGDVTFYQDSVYPQTASTRPDAGYYQNFADITAFSSGINTLVTEKLSLVSADLSISITADEDVCAGEEVFYTVTVCNNGPLDVDLIDFEVILPVGFEYLADSWNAGGVTPDPGGDIVSFTDLQLDCGECAEVIVKTRVPSNFVADHPDTPDPNAADAFTAIATANILSGQTQPDDNADNDTDSVGTFIQECTDLKVERVAITDSVPVGETMQYQIYVTNCGPSDARGVVVTEDYSFPPNFIAASVSLSSGYSLCSFNDLFVYPLDIDICENIPAGDTLGIEFTITTGGEGQDLNSVTSVVTLSNDSDASNNSAHVTTLLESTSDLEITKAVIGEVQTTDAPAGDPSTPTADEVTAGLTMTYNITVTNPGPSTATNVVLTDLLPGGVSLVQGGVVLSQGSVEYGIPGDPGAPLICHLGNIDAGADPVTVDITVLVGSNVSHNTVLNNSARVTSESVDLDQSNNVASAQALVNTFADTKITKLSIGENVVDYDEDLSRHIFEDTLGAVTAGLELRYEITVQNDGPSDALGVQVLDLLPGQQDTGLDHDPINLLRVVGAEYTILDEFQEIGVFGPEPGHGKFGQVLWLDLGDMPVGTRRTFQIYVQTDTSIPDGTTLTNGAYVWWGPTSGTPGFLGFPFPQIPALLPTTDDSFLDNNYADTDTNVSAVADLEIIKTMVSNGVQPDGTIEFEVTIINHGPSDAQDVFFDDVWSGLNVPVITPNFSVDIPAGESFTWDVVVEVDPSEAEVDEFTNEATITSATTDYNDTNNVSVVVVGGDDTCKVPLAPVELVASDGTRPKEVILTWEYIEDAQSYVVYRSVTPYFSNADPIATVLNAYYLDLPPEDPERPERGLNCAFDSPQVFYYWVEAVNNCGPSEPSNMDQGFALYNSALKSANTLPRGDLLTMLGTCYIGYVLYRRSRKRAAAQ